ncbi:lactonase family protein [Actinomadura flavalba]|uniref:lactonase family protein n=1 Tax=Actinomadura flavalba TaxID=1120938 RepID=UPI000366C122|nr:lactonase family protein [Actinomadura flavalba]
MSTRAWWAGTYTGDMGRGRGVYLLRQGADGALDGPSLAAETVAPSYLAAGPRGDRLYAVREQPEGGVVAFAVGADGTLRETGSRTLPADPCHLAVSPDGRTLLVACYTAGTVAALALDEAGDLTGDPGLFHGRGSGPRTDRQDAPHAHNVLWTPDGTALATDLGTDTVRTLRARGGELEVLAELAVPPGHGPRHLALHPSGRVYLMCELEPRLLVLTPGGSYADLSVTAESAATAGATPNGSTGAAIKIGADGAFVYTSMRGADVVTAHRVEDGGARLSPVADVPSGGAGPRDLWADAAALLVANENGGGVTAFAIGADGVPVATGANVDVPSPVCLITARFPR